MKRGENKERTIQTDEEGAKESPSCGKEEQKEKEKRKESNDGAEGRREEEGEGGDE